MEGDITSPENMGVIPRSVHAIFDYLDGISADYTVRTSFLELYNEVLYGISTKSSIAQPRMRTRAGRKGVAWELLFHLLSNRGVCLTAATVGIAGRLATF